MFHRGSSRCRPRPIAILTAIPELGGQARLRWVSSHCLLTEIDRPGIGLVPLLSKVAEQTESLYKGETPRLELLHIQDGGRSFQEIVDDVHGLIRAEGADTQEDIE
jgi:hypothetical protein